MRPRMGIAGYERFVGNCLSNWLLTIKTAMGASCLQIELTQFQNKQYSKKSSDNENEGQKKKQPSVDPSTIVVEY